MRQYRRYGLKIASNVLRILLPLTLGIYILRGLGILTFIPGGMILMLMILSIISLIVYGFEKTGGF